MWRLLRTRLRTAVAAVIVVVALTLAYSNHFHNSFHFDDAHTIVNNAAIRELANIPSFFSDATTFSALPSNQSYRPLVSTLLAVDYRLAGGLRPFWFHISIMALFVALTLLLAFIVRCLLDHEAKFAGNYWLALVAAAWYGLHPANADTVNYIIASSEVISTLGVIASFALYFVFPQARRYYLFVFPAAVAILAKPPAAAFAALFAVHRLLFSQEGKGRFTFRVRALGWLADVLPPFVICGAMLLLVQHMTPHTWIAGAANSHDYLITQPYVALLYCKTFFWPSALCADYDLNPFVTIGDTRFWLGFAFLLLLVVAASATAACKKTRVIAFGLLWFLTALLSTSALPLAELMNDHRTFFPYIGLIIAVAGRFSLIFSRAATFRIPGKIATVSAAVLFLCTSGYTTWQRNKVWESEETLWHDVTIKSPRNGRGLMNYGNTLMAKGGYKAALDYFHQAQVLTPFYPVLFVNLGVAEGAPGQATSAEQDFRQALRLAPSNPDCYTYYARWLLTQSRAREALPLLRKAVGLGPSDVAAHNLLKAAETGTGVAVGTQTPEFYLALSLERYRAQRYEETIAACRSALALRPDYAEAWNNVGAAYNKLGQYDKGGTACEQALLLDPQNQLAQNNLRYAREMTRKLALRRWAADD